MMQAGNRFTHSVTEAGLSPMATQRGAGLSLVKWHSIKSIGIKICDLIWHKNAKLNKSEIVFGQLEY